VGIETISNRVLRGINKQVDASTYESLFRVIRKLDLGVIVSVIVGLPNETPEEMLATLSWIEGHLTSKDRFIRCLFTPFPGLKIHDSQDFSIFSTDLSMYTMDIPLVTSSLFSLGELLAVKDVADQLMLRFGPSESTRNPMPIAAISEDLSKCKRLIR